MNVARARAAALLILLPRWNSHKKPPVFPRTPACTYSRTLWEIFSTSQVAFAAEPGKIVFSSIQVGDAKTGSLVREIADLDYIVVD